LALQKERQEKGEKLYSYTDLANMLPVWKEDPNTAFLEEAPAQCLQPKIPRAYKLHLITQMSII
jgi:putative transposase